MVVTDSKDSTLVGTHGFVVDETRNTFVLATPKGLKTVLKERITFVTQNKKHHGINFMKTIENRIQR